MVQHHVIEPLNALIVYAQAVPAPLHAVALSQEPVASATLIAALASNLLANLSLKFIQKLVCDEMFGRKMQCGLY